MEMKKRIITSLLSNYLRLGRTLRKSRIEQSSCRASKLNLKWMSHLSRNLRSSMVSLKSWRSSGTIERNGKLTMKNGSTKEFLMLM